jgi:hypothetical protein
VLLPKTKAAKRLARWLALLAVVGALSLLLLETLVRLLMPQPESMRWHLPDERYGHVMRPGYHQRYPFLNTDFVMDVRTNTAGLRDEEIGPRNAETKTVVLAGDSFMFGYAVNIEDRLDTPLGALLGPSHRVINTGTVAWGTLQETAYLRDHFEDFEPDVIVLAFCGNDPDDDRVFQRKRVSFDEYTFPGKALLRRYSHAFRLVTHRFAAWRQSRHVRSQTRDENEGTGEPALDPQTFAPRLASDLAESMRRLQELHDTFVAFNPDGVLVLVATMPTDEIISAHLGGLDNGSSLRYVDLADDARALGAGVRQPFDGHWSPAMHGAVAEKLAQAIQNLP